MSSIGKRQVASARTECARPSGRVTTSPKATADKGVVGSMYNTLDAFGLVESRGDDADAVEYNADPSMTDVPLSLDDIRSLSENEGRAVRQDPRKMSHLLARMSATIVRANEDARSLRSELERMRNREKQGAGQSSTLSPLDAVRYLSPEQLQQVFGTVAKAQMDWLKVQKTETENTRRRIETILARLRYVDVSATETPAVSSHPLMVSLHQALREADAAIGSQSSPGSQVAGSPSTGGPFSLGPEA